VRDNGSQTTTWYCLIGFHQESQDVLEKWPTHIIIISRIMTVFFHRHTLVLPLTHNIITIGDHNYREDFLCQESVTFSHTPLLGHMVSLEDHHSELRAIT
jgi:hypothetical protein